MRSHLSTHRLPVNKRTAVAVTRRAAAAVEMALLTPFLILLVLGAIDCGQLINVSQSVSNASRVGAKMAARNTTNDVAEIVTAVRNYLSSQFQASNASSSGSGSGSGKKGKKSDGGTQLTGETVRVNVYDESGNEISGTDLALVPAGSSIRVDVTVEFDSVRWMPNFVVPEGKELTTSCIMRRQ